MEPTLIRHSQIDKNKWNKTVMASHNCLPYACSWYLDVVSPGWDALIGGDYDYVFPLTWRKKWNITYLCQPLFCQQLGLFSPHEITSDILHNFITSLSQHYSFAEINLNFANIIQFPSVHLSSRLNFEMALNKAYPEIKKFYSDNQQRNIRKATNAQAELTDLSLSELIELYRTDQSAKHEKLKKNDFDLLRQLFEALSFHTNSFIRGVKINHKILSAALFVQFNNRLIFLFSGNSTEGKSLGAMSFLIDSVISEYAGQPIIFDFEGSNHPGLARFYSSFGSIEHVYLHLKLNNLPFPLRLLKK